MNIAELFNSPLKILIALAVVIIIVVAIMKKDTTKSPMKHVQFTDGESADLIREIYKVQNNNLRISKVPPV